MKNICINKYMVAVTAVIASLVSCTRIEEQEIPDVAPKVHMTFTADIEGRADTKTVLGGQMGDTYRKLLWEPQDSIGITSSLSNASFDKFVNIETSLSGVGTFDGSTSEGSTYYLFYPYSSTLLAKDGDKITFKLPSTQVYRKDSFTSDAMPMVSKGPRGERYRFYSLCGVFALNLTGSETVRSVSFTGKDASGNYLPVSGDYYVNMNYEEYPEIFPHENVGSSVTLNCGEGVTLDPSKPTPFYIVLPVAKYESFTIMVSTSDGKMMLKEVNKTLEIKRSNVTKTASLAYVASSEVFNLSGSGWANCYVISEPGLYSFDATVIGNGDFGMIADAGFHTTSTSISPASAEIVWEDVPGVITAPSFDGQRINFMASGIEGNSVVAAKDADGTILWSWHIWSTDSPVEQTYENSVGIFQVLDRNLGATRANKGTGDEWLDSRGLVYFWGRKDPFWYGAYDHIQGPLTLEEAIANPNKRHEMDSWTGGQTSWLVQHNPYLWSANTKTIYDPCPQGYRVACYDVWKGFTVTELASKIVSEFNVKGGFDNGWEFYIDKDKSMTAWYPIVYSFETCRGHNMSPWRSGVWASDYSWYSHKYFFGYNANNVQIDNHLNDDGYACSVRCMKDDGYVDMSIPVVEVVEVSNVTETSAKVVANVISEGASEVTERGIIWGADPELSDGVKVSCGSGTGEFSCDLTGLESGSIYYVKAYAVNDHGKSYTDVRVFSTRYSDEYAVDLSKYETANSYIVSSPGLYIINCLVKGNSTESVGTPVSAAVVWETRNSNTPVTEGSIVTSVELHGGYLSFEIPAQFTPGNALVAVKDASGNILWSWHIWVTDFDPDLTAQTYISGAVMMDRNLGALRSTPGDPSVNGFFYQWGRKDPLLGAYDGDSFISTYPVDVKQYSEAKDTDKLTYSIQNPSTVVYDFNSKSGSWDISKTMYDPCPAGWRVPEGGSGVWEGITEHEMKDSGYYFYAPFSSPEAFYPGTGYTNCSSAILFYGSAIYSWSCSPINDNDAYTMCMFYDTHDPNRGAGKRDEHPVRCQMMESGYSVEIIDLVSEAQSSVTVKGKLSITRDCKIDEMGIVYSTTDALPTVDVNEGKIKSESVDVGEFECTVTGIKRQTKYYIRPYVMGEKGVKYGKVVEYIERSPGSGEGFTGDDFVWE